MPRLRRGRKHSIDAVMVAGDSRPKRRQLKSIIVNPSCRSSTGRSIRIAGREDSSGHRALQREGWCWMEPLRGRDIRRLALPALEAAWRKESRTARKELVGIILSVLIYKRVNRRLKRK